ncbi:hypothetical protein [Neokomagataea thailandica]|uniref:Uncharacterized protein n=1 Tax=Neokomagataea tanensis NBRC 106556 TaxID=1223519 RepID=A0ABQ0QFR3_9PROT|nr:MULTISPECIES: hypothetical protein [Neokomagataea]GBR43281.1 hypothetical protein AA106556_0036 [Neokomagataea tanensis NBRC 106556]
MPRFIALASESGVFQPTVSVASAQWRGLDRLAHPRVNKATYPQPPSCLQGEGRAVSSLTDMCCCERLALWSIRCLSGHFRVPPCRETRTTDGMFPDVFAPLFDAAEHAFAEAQKKLQQAQHPALDISRPGAQALTLTEDALVNGVRAAQNDDVDTVRQILDRVLSNHVAVGDVLTALTLLAECMAGAGHWLPRSGEGA